MQLQNNHLSKIYDIINSCTNEDQLLVAEDWVHRYLFMVDPTLATTRDSSIHGVWNAISALIANKSNKFKI